MDNHPYIIEAVLYANCDYGLLHGDCLDVLKYFPDSCVDCVITSPPYWQQRDYSVTSDYRQFLIGEEATLPEYIAKLINVFAEVKRILKPSGSLWLNIGDKYINKNLMGIPWRVALALQDAGWILRNDVIWEKMKGAEPVKDRLRHNHEHLFHFVKNSKYYYHVENILIPPRLSPTIEAGKTISATGVSGKKYRQQILNATQLTDAEKQTALAALENTLQKIRDGEVIDFRMTIRGYQRTLHGDASRLSGRARELEQNGFFIIQSYAKGYVPSDVWRIVPEDNVKNRHQHHYAVFPVELLKIPLLATCPPDGVVLDPFAGSGSTIEAALAYRKRGLGIDISKDYLNAAHARLNKQQRLL